MTGRMKRMPHTRSGWMRLLWLVPLIGTVSFLSCSVSRDRQGDNEGDGKVPVDMRLPREDLPSCVGLGCFVANCPVGQDTTVVGKVTAPNGVDPIREALVYVPSGGNPEEFPPKVSCETCNSPMGGTPVTAVSTDVDGSFSLRRVPVTTSTPIVIQKGRWRKVINLNIGRCETQGITAEQGRLPKDRFEGTLPKMALATGQWDAIECVLRRIGIAESEFGSPSTAGSVHIYDNDASGTAVAPGGVNVGDLLRNLNRLLDYHILFLNCSDVAYARGLLSDPTVKKNLAEYAARGGRMYVTDYSYNFIQQIPEFAPFICFNDDKPCTDTTPHGFHTATGIDKIGNQNVFYADVNQTHSGGRALATWLTNLPKPILGGKVRIEDSIASYVLIRQMAQDPNKHPSTVWLSADLKSQNRPVTVTFDYPAGPAACGRVLFSTYHTRHHAASMTTFPNYCPGGATLPQENVLEFLIFELGACIQPPG